MMGLGRAMAAKGHGVLRRLIHLPVSSNTLQRAKDTADAFKC